MGNIGRAEGTDVFLAWVQSEGSPFEDTSVVGNAKIHGEIRGMWLHQLLFKMMIMTFIYKI